MNISMQDAHNLAWKLAYAISGLTPNPSALLQTYEAERRPAASKVVFFDKRWNQSDIPRAQMIDEAKDQILGVGVEYDSNMIVGKKAEDQDQDQDHRAKTTYPINGKGYSYGVIREGRRLLNVRVRRFADTGMWDIHDDLLANGRYRIIAICGNDFPDTKGTSLSAATSACELVKKFPDGLVEALVIQPDMKPTWGFDDLPGCIKDEAEMRLYCAGQEVYAVYGVDVKRGALVLVRPDGMVGLIANIGEIASVERFLQQVLVAA